MPTKHNVQDDTECASAWTSQNGTFALKSTGGFGQRSVSPCTIRRTTLYVSALLIISSSSPQSFVRLSSLFTVLIARQQINPASSLFTSQLSQGDVKVSQIRKHRRYHRPHDSLHELSCCAIFAQQTISLHHLSHSGSECKVDGGHLLIVG